ncbi:MAG: hypothetical protein WCF57_04075 [Pyrinomonadaceae bacterium]
MSSRGKQAARGVATFLIITLFQTYVLANSTRPNINPGTPPAALVYGKLSLPANKAILVNGNSVNAGTTIFSGSQLQTPADTEAAVQLGDAGQLDIAPDSALTVTFNKTSVDVRVTKGSVALSTNAGVKGTVTNADGTVETSNPATASSIIGGMNVGKAARAAALSKEEKAALIIIPIAIAAIIIFVVARDDDDDDISSSNPNRLQ